MRVRSRRPSRLLAEEAVAQAVFRAVLEVDDRHLLNVQLDGEFQLVEALRRPGRAGRSSRVRWGPAVRLSDRGGSPG